MSFKCFKMESHLFSSKGKVWKVNNYTASEGSISFVLRRQIGGVLRENLNWWNWAIYTLAFKIKIDVDKWSECPQ